MRDYMFSASSAVRSPDSPTQESLVSGSSLAKLAPVSLPVADKKTAWPTRQGIRKTLRSMKISVAKD